MISSVTVRSKTKIWKCNVPEFGTFTNIAEEWISYFSIIEIFPNLETDTSSTISLNELENGSNKFKNN